MIVVGLNSIAPESEQPAGTAHTRPDLAAGAAQIIDALLADPLVEDIQTLTTINELVGDQRAPDPVHLRRAARRATRSARSPATSSAATIRSCCTSTARRSWPSSAGSIDADADPLHGELMSYLFFAPEFARALIERGRADAERWLDEPHDDGLWDTGPLGRHRPRSPHCPAFVAS